MTCSILFPLHKAVTCCDFRLLPTVFPRLIASAAKTPSLRLTHSQVYKETLTTATFHVHKEYQRVGSHCITFLRCYVTSFFVLFSNILNISQHLTAFDHISTSKDSCTIFLGKRRICFDLVPPVRPEMIAVRRLQGGDEVAERHRCLRHLMKFDDLFIYFL